MLDELGQRVVVAGAGARPAKDLGGPPRPGGDARDQAGGGRAEAAERGGASRWLNARRAPVSWFIEASRWLSERSMLRAMPRS